MSTPTYTLINQVTLASNSSEVVFSSIPQNYKDLIIVINAATTVNANNRMRFNGDAGANNYALIFMWGDGSGIAVESFTLSWAPIDWSAFTTPTLGATNHIVQIMDYSATDKHKVALNRGNRPGGLIEALTSRWANNNAINSIAFSGGTFLAGSTFSMYGIVG